MKLFSNIHAAARQSRLSGILLKRRKRVSPVALGISMVIGLAGIYMIFASFAAGTSVSLQAEVATLGAPAAIVNDQTASGGQAVQFGGTIASNPSPTTAPTATPVSGVAYYVDCTAGSDSNSGASTASAWQTLGKANAATIGAGQSLLFKRGCSFGGGALIVKWSGITVGAYGTGAAPVFTGNGDSSNHVEITGDNNVIDGLAAVGSNRSCSSCTGAGFNLANGATGNTLRNSLASGKWAGVYLRDGANNNLITRNTIKDNRMLQDRGGSDDDSGAFGILVHGSSNDISYNDFSGQNVNSPDYGMDGAAVEFYTLAGKSPASNNKVHHNKSVNDNAFSELGKDSSASSPSGNIFAYNSYVSSGIGNAIFLNTRGTGNFGPVNNTIVYNNSVYITGSSKAALVCGSCSSSILTAKNNILISSGGATSGTGNYSNNVTSNPYVSAPSNLTLRAGTSAVDGGVNDTVVAQFTIDLANMKVPAGNARDVGAYEFGSTLAAAVQGALNQALAQTNGVLADVTSAVGSWLRDSGTAVAAWFRAPELPGGKAHAVGSVSIAAVGDMNPEGNTSTSSNSGKNAAGIAAALASGEVSAFLGLGDFQYTEGNCSKYVNAWNKLWGPVLPKTYWVAAPNHDWQPGRNEDLDNFMNGQCAGSTTKSAINAQRGFIENGTPYSYDLGNWHFAALSTALWRYDSTRAKAATTWLDSDLAAAKAAGKHLAVVYHDPYFTSSTSSHSRETAVKPWIDVMWKHRVKLTLSGSQHNYERSCPVNNADQCVTDGMTAFNVSTGGIGLRSFTSSPSYITKRFSDTYGWLKLTLNDDGSFSWQYKAVSGSGTDSGTRGGTGTPGTTAPATPTPTPAACGTAPAATQGSATASVAIPSAGTYRVWSRIKPASTTADTYWLKVGNCAYEVRPSAPTAGSWQWVDYTAGSTAGKLNLSLAAGNQAITMVGTEAGVGLDRIIFTTDTACVPSGTGDNCAATTATPTPAATTPPVSGSAINDSNYTYAGTWQTAAAADTYQGDEHYSSTVGATYTINFTGTQLRIYGTKDAHHGIAAISVDGGPETNVDFYSATRQAQAVVYTTPVLANGSHSVRVRVTGTSNAASTGAVITGDRADILTATAYDLNGDGKVNVFDLSIILAAWGKTSPTADLNKDGTVNIFDLSLLLGNWKP